MDYRPSPYRWYHYLVAYGLFVLVVGGITALGLYASVY